MKVCKIESTVAALEDAIHQKRAQIRQSRVRSPGLFSAIPGILPALLNKAREPVTKIAQSLGAGKTWGREFLTNVRQDLHDDPWSMVRKVAVVSFATGLVLRAGRKRPNGEKA